METKYASPPTGGKDEWRIANETENGVTVKRLNGGRG